MLKFFLNMDSPPYPAMPALWAWSIAGGAVVVGLLMVLWGRKLQRFFVALGCGALGLLAAPFVAAKLGVQLWIAQLSTGVAAAAFGAVLARFVWALVGGALLGAVGGQIALCMIYRDGGGSLPVFGAHSTYLEYLYAMVVYYWDAAKYAWSVQPVFIIAATAGPALVGIVAGVLLPRIWTRCMSALAGAVVLTAGLALGVVLANPPYWSYDAVRLYILAGVAGAAFVFGVVFQSIGHRRRAKKDKEAKEAPAEKPEGSKKTAPAK